MPVDGLIPEIVAKLGHRPMGARSIVVQASPGSGKTTRIPPALLPAPLSDEGSAPARECVVLEPRRMAAKYAARRVAEEMGSRLGEVVGYQFRFENVTSPLTRLRFLTEGMLMRRLLGDPELRSTHTVILDEFHERHLHGDLALAYLRRLQLTKRPDLRLVVMSATLDTESISKFLGDAPVLKIDAPVHPVELEYLPSAPSKRLEALVADAVRVALSPARADDSGDILVFLPGMAEIRRATSALHELAERAGALLAPLHGELSREEQDAAIGPSARRKIILATNVAETSLTIPGVRTVIDSGFHRVASYSWWSGIPTLRTRPISRASAIQRAGRAGRTAPGRCVRLYTRGDFEGRAPFQTPEIQRADLAQSVLELKSLGVLSASELPWLEAPPAQSLEGAESLLFNLGALVANGGALTEIGRRLSRIPAHPRVGRMLLAAAEASGDRDGARDIQAAAADLAALISEGELGNPDAIEDVLAGSRGARLPESARRLAEQLRASMKVFSGKGLSGASSAAPSEKNPGKILAQAVLHGFPDRVARRKSGGELLFSAGGAGPAPEGARGGDFFRSSEFFVLLDVREKQGLGQARSSVEIASAVAIEPDWLLDLEPQQVVETEELVWDPSRKRVQAISRLTYGQLVLSESRAEPRSDAMTAEKASPILAKEGLGLDLESWGGGKKTASLHDALHSLDRLAESSGGGERDIEAWAARLELLRRLRPALPPVTPELLRELVQKILAGATDLETALTLSWRNSFNACLDQLVPGTARELERLTPQDFQLPNGRRARIHYRLGAEPWIESRLQDFFGVKSPPSILSGGVPLTLHLLAPNQRAVQVTSDLPGFWKRTYPEIRKELSRRYPRHSWPEDPTVAEPTRR